MAHLTFFIALAAAAAAFAMLEIQIEGEEGWAANLPTWRLESPWARMLLGGRTLTGYHLWIHLFVLVLLHLPYALWLTPFTWAAELRLLAFLTLFWVLEDFLWFVLNPAYGVRRFRRETVDWHAHSWWGIMPREYWIFLPVGLALYLTSWSGT